VEQDVLHSGPSVAELCAGPGTCAFHKCVKAGPNGNSRPFNRGQAGMAGQILDGTLVCLPPHLLLQGWVPALVR
jgi:hypothetical protein